MANTAFDHASALTIPGSTTNNGLVRWGDTSGTSFGNITGITSDGSNITLLTRGEIRFSDADSTHFIAFESPATVGTSYTMTLPSDLPAADEVLTVTSYSGGAGVLEWATAGGGIASVLADTTPQLGGNLDMQARLLVGNGGSTGIAISANGEVTMAAQPAFSVYMNSEMTNATGNGTTVTVEMDTEVFDQNADFNTSNYTFTAPVTGRYFLTTYVLVAGMNVNGAAMQFHIDASNRDWYMESGSPYLASQISPNMAALIDMDAADTAVVKCRGVSLGADIADIAGIDGALVRTMFTGFLVA